MGSGAGLPGVPIAIAVPGAHVVLAEPRRSRVAFLELVVDELHLENATVHAGRVEDLAPGYDVTLARGFAGPVATWGSARRLLRGTGRLFYWAGASFDPARDGPPDALVDVHRRADLESAGPIVIMARQ
jgi:16S rRNA (guanine527-N7)-methyltransferase